MKRSLTAIAVVGALFAALTSATAAPSFTDQFLIDKTDLSSTGSNPYMILEPGYRLTLGNGDTSLTITVLNETKVVDGVETRVVEERETQGGKITEVSRNYLVISRKANSVFYFGEDGGGSWLAGEKGARAGILMPGTVLLGARYYNEVAPGVAMDRAEIVSTNMTYRTPAGKFKNVLKIEESSPLEPGVKEYKLFAPGIGLIKDSNLELVQYGYVK